VYSWSVVYPEHIGVSWKIWCGALRHRLTVATRADGGVSSLVGVKNLSKLIDIFEDTKPDEWLM
jgi:hypothetical protein